jgi:hypothetical protein
VFGLGKDPGIAPRRSPKVEVPCAAPRLNGFVRELHFGFERRGQPPLSLESSRARDRAVCAVRAHNYSSAVLVAVHLDTHSLIVNRNSFYARVVAYLRACPACLLGQERVKLVAHHTPADGVLELDGKAQLFAVCDRSMRYRILDG